MKNALNDIMTNWSITRVGTVASFCLMGLILALKVTGHV